MLILTRNVSQRIKVGEDIWVTLVSYRDGKAKIGIEAPRDVPVHREEVAGEMSGRGRMTSDRHVITVRLSPELHALLKSVAESRGVTMNELCVKVLSGAETTETEGESNEIPV